MRACIGSAVGLKICWSMHSVKTGPQKTAPTDFLKLCMLDQFSMIFRLMTSLTKTKAHNDVKLGVKNRMIFIFDRRRSCDTSNQRIFQGELKSVSIFAL